MEKSVYFDEISDEEWLLLAPVLSDATIARGKRGRPRTEVRVVANAVLWILTTGEPWSRLPENYPSVPTCRCRYQKWRASGALAEMQRRLSSVGRTFRYGPNGLAEVRHTAPQRLDRPLRDNGLRQVSWKSQASWQASHDILQRPHTPDMFTEIARRLPDSSRAMPARIDSRAPANARQTNLTSESPARDVACQGKREFDPRGYVIHVAADRVASARFRGWAEIVLDEQRIARSGLIGPSFTTCEAAQLFALEWARRWLDDESGADRDDFDAANGDLWQRNARSG